MEKESNRARAAFEDYYDLGPGRSLAQLARTYRERTKPLPPTRQLSRLKQWSTDYGWVARVAELDLEIAKAAQAARVSARVAERKEALQTDLSARPMSRSMAALLKFGEMGKSVMTDIYFIQQGQNGPIKIGITRRIEQRLAELQTGVSDHLHLLGTMPGTAAHEKQLHAQFHAHRVRGEWFNPVPELRRYIWEHTHANSIALPGFDRERRKTLIAILDPDYRR